MKLRINPPGHDTWHVDLGAARPAPPRGFHLQGSAIAPPERITRQQREAWRASKERQRAKREASLRGDAGSS